MICRIYLATLLLASASLTNLFGQTKFVEIDFADVHPTPDNHLRIMTWNLEVFNERNANDFHKSNPNGPRSDEELNLLARRMIGFDAAIIALQEMNQIAAIHDLRDRMNNMAGGGHPWKIFPPNTEDEQQNALLYNDDLVDLISSEFVLSTPSAGDYPVESSYRAPVTGVFSADSNANSRFRVIGIHGSWQGESVREQQGPWLASYVADLLAKPEETRHIVLAGDMNGVAATGNSPHDGIVSGREMTYVSKSNGESTAIGEAMIDSFYVSKDTSTRLTSKKSFVIRPDFFGETIDQFRRSCSDHFPVFIEFSVQE